MRYEQEEYKTCCYQGEWWMWPVFSSKSDNGQPDPDEDDDEDAADVVDRDSSTVVVRLLTRLYQEDVTAIRKFKNFLPQELLSKIKSSTVLVEDEKECWPSSVDFGSTIALSTSLASSDSIASRSWKLPNFTNPTLFYFMAVHYFNIMTIIKNCDLCIIELVFERASLLHWWHHHHHCYPHDLMTIINKC